MSSHSHVSSSYAGKR
ncbi:hypothetical protein LINGRAHAP2_LOCUS34577 [Linum grandiflorum]